MRESTIIGSTGLLMLTVVAYMENGILPAAIWLTGGMLLMTVSYRITRSVKDEEN